MNLIQPKSLVIGVAMLAAAGAAIAMKPTERMADTRGRVDLETAIPQQFGDWKVDTTIVPIQVSPEVQQHLDKFYDQILARTYVNSKGQRVMLSIAYGGSQSRNLQIHRPEVCYTAQGFSVGNIANAMLSLAESAVPSRTLVARQGGRIEPITYWMRVGDEVLIDGLQQALARYKYGLTGVVPDGVLIRISNISDSAEQSYRLHQEFAGALVQNLPKDAKLFLLGG